MLINFCIGRSMQGFAMLRQLNSSLNSIGVPQPAPGYDVQPIQGIQTPTPTYVEGYGFVPPSQVPLVLSCIKKEVQHCPFCRQNEFCDKIVKLLNALSHRVPSFHYFCQATFKQAAH